MESRGGKEGQREVEGETGERVKGVSSTHEREGKMRSPFNNHVESAHENGIVGNQRGR